MVMHGAAWDGLLGVMHGAAWDDLVVVGGHGAALDDLVLLLLHDDGAYDDLVMLVHGGAQDNLSVVVRYSACHMRQVGRVLQLNHRGTLVEALAVQIDPEEGQSLEV